MYFHIPIIYVQELVSLDAIRGLDGVYPPSGLSRRLRVDLEGRGVTKYTGHSCRLSIGLIMRTPMAIGGALGSQSPMKPSCNHKVYINKIISNMILVPHTPTHIPIFILKIHHPISIRISYKIPSKNVISK